jgi:hypothetical protein
MLDRSKEETGLTKEEILWIANLLGKAVGGNEGQGVAGSAAKYNYLSHWQKTQLRLAIESGNQEMIEYWQAIDRAQDQIIAMMGLDPSLILDDPAQEFLRNAIYESAQKIKGNVPLFAVNPDKLSVAERAKIKSIKDIFNDSVDYIKYGIAVAIVVIPTHENLTAAKTIEIGGAITIGSNIYYEMRYSDGGNMQKTAYVGKEILLYVLSGQAKAGERYIKSWDNEQGRKLLNAFGKDMQDVKIVGTMLDIIADAMTSTAIDRVVDGGGD